MNSFQAKSEKNHLYCFFYSFLRECSGLATKRKRALSFFFTVTLYFFHKPPDAFFRSLQKCLEIVESRNDRFKRRFVHRSFAKFDKEGKVSLSSVR